jgi:hypothetical protein
MKNIHLVNEQTFHGALNLANILEDSAFYPAAEMDARDIECLNGICNSFVHVDYSYS